MKCFSVSLVSLWVLFALFIQRGAILGASSLLVRCCCMLCKSQLQPLLAHMGEYMDISKDCTLFNLLNMWSLVLPIPWKRNADNTLHICFLISDVNVLLD